MQAQEVSYMGMSDEALIGAVFELVGGVDDEELRDELDAGLAEVFERAMPEALKRETLRGLQEDEPEHAAAEMDAFLATLESRATFRPLAQLLGGGRSG